MIQELSALIKNAYRLQIGEMRKNRLFKMLVIGAFGFLVQATFFELFAIQFSLFRPSTAALLGAELAIVVNFFLHNHFTFPDRRVRTIPNLFGKFFQFNLAVAVSLLIQWGMVWIGEIVAPESAMLLRLFNVTGVVVGFIFNYFSYTKLIWRNRNFPHESIGNQP